MERVEGERRQSIHRVATRKVDGNTSGVHGGIGAGHRPKTTKPTMSRILSGSGWAALRSRAGHGHGQADHYTMLARIQRPAGATACRRRRLRAPRPSACAWLRTARSRPSLRDGVRPTG